MVRRTIFVLAFLMLASGALSFVHPWGDLHHENANTAILSGGEVPDDVRGILERKCADCHSNNTHWPVYSRPAPASWLLEHDVVAGRTALNLSTWAGMGTQDRISALAGIAAEVRSGEMPPKPYALMHAAFLTESDKQKIAAWSRAERKRLRAQTSGDKEKK
jgi:cytochrome c